MGANYAPLLADLFLYCYESEYMLNLSKSGNIPLAEKFNNTFRYIDDILSMDNPVFTDNIQLLYPSELQLNKSNTSAFWIFNLKLIMEKLVSRFIINGMILTLQS